MVGRVIADHLQQTLGQPFVIENRPGASANTGTDIVAKAEPDGYTIGISLGGAARDQYAAVRQDAVRPEDATSR